MYKIVIERQAIKQLARIPAPYNNQLLQRLNVWQKIQGRMAI